jgi:hypothetical protein
MQATTHPLMDARFQLKQRWLATSEQAQLTSCKRQKSPEAPPKRSKATSPPHASPATDQLQAVHLKLAASEPAAPMGPSDDALRMPPPPPGRSSAAPRSSGSARQRPRTPEAKKALKAQAEPQASDAMTRVARALGLKPGTTLAWFEENRGALQRAVQAFESGDAAGVARFKQIIRSAVSSSVAAQA